MYLHDSLHWSLVVICHPGEVTCFKGKIFPTSRYFMVYLDILHLFLLLLDEEIKESAKVPCILHMDSLKGSHKGLRNVFQR